MKTKRRENKQHKEKKCRMKRTVQKREMVVYLEVEKRGRKMGEEREKHWRSRGVWKEKWKDGDSQRRRNRVRSRAETMEENGTFKEVKGREKRKRERENDEKKKTLNGRKTQVRDR